MNRPAVDFEPADDPRVSGAPLPCAAELPVLGWRVRFESNSRYVLDLVDESFGLWRRLAAAAPEAPVRLVRIVVFPAERSSEPAAGHALRHLCPPDGRLIVECGASGGVSDPAGHTAFAYVAASLAAERVRFRDGVLEALTLALLSSADRHPIHAAAVARADRALLLHGPSGTGKSSLALAAHHAGLDVMSEDRVHVQLEPRLRVWGWPGSIRLLEQVATHAATAGQGASEIGFDGTRKVRVQIHEPGAGCFVAGAAQVVVLEPGSAAPSIAPIAAGEVRARLVGDVAPGFDRFPERHEMVARRLAEPGGWRLMLSRDAREAVPLLQELLDRR